MLAALAAAVWGGAVWLERHTRPPRPQRRAAAAVLAAGVLVAAVVGVASAGRIADTARAQYDAFVTLGAAHADSGSRLVSGAGNRYDYWRVAWHAWQDAPVRGVGAGNYDRRYFAERSVTEDVRQPHSIELQLLSELGVVGLALLLVVLGAHRLGRPPRAGSPAAAGRRGPSRPRRSARRRRGWCTRASTGCTCCPASPRSPSSAWSASSRSGRSPAGAGRSSSPSPSRS